jgi:hypothetical protein
VFNPEGAIETAAALQRLGVTQSQLLDPLRLMDLSQNDPEELQRQMSDLAKGFVELNEKGRFQIAPGEQRRLREVAEAMGMNYDQLSKMAIGAKELDDKMQKIRFPDSIKEEDRQFISNMAEMNEKGQYVIEYKGEAREVNDLLQEFGGDQQALAKFMEDSQPKSMEELAKEQLNALQAIQANLGAVEGRTGYAIAGSELGGQMIDAITKGYEKTVEVFDGLDIKTLRDHYEKNGEAILDSVNKVLTGEGSVEDVFSALGTTVSSTKDLFEGAFKEGIESAKKSTDDMSTSQNKFVELLNNSMEGFKNAAVKAEGFANQTATAGNTSTTQNMTTNPNLNQINSTTMGGTNTTAQQTPMTTNSNSTISMNIKLDAPPNIDTAQLQKILQDPMFQQELIKAVQNAQSNNGLTPAGNPMM